MRAMVMGLVAFLALGAARAQETEERQRSPAELRPGESTGRLRHAPIDSAGTSIAPPAPLDVAERPVRAPEEESAMDAPPPAVAAPDDEHMRGRLAAARVCPMVVAAERRVSLDRVPAGRLELRWTVLPTGEVEATEVVAQSPTDPAVLDCVKRRMAAWRFAPPEDRAPTRMTVQLSFD